MYPHRMLPSLLLVLGLGLVFLLLSPRVGGGQGRVEAARGPGLFPAQGLAQGLDLMDAGEPLAPVLPFFPLLPPLPEGGISLGTTSTGKLFQADALPPDHPGFRIMPRQKARSLHYGNRGMVWALVESAEAVALRHPGSILSLGDVAAKNGGDIWWSVSHNNGRDADIAFFYRARTGEDVVPEDFIPLNARLRSADKQVVFDAERTWTVVRTLILSPHVRLQWLFISRPLREALLEHARQLEEAPELIAKAEELLGQPGDALAHNDHLHVRILCSPLEIVSGCMDMGRMPSWVEDPAVLRQARIEQLWGLLRASDPERRARAAELLGYLGAGSAWTGLERLLLDPVPRVQLSAARGLELLIGSLPVRGGIPLRDVSDPDDEGGATPEGEGGVPSSSVPAPVTPAPLTPAPVTPAPVTPAPAMPAPVTKAAGGSKAAIPQQEEDFTGGVGAPPEFPPSPDRLETDLADLPQAPVAPVRRPAHDSSGPSAWERGAVWPEGELLPLRVELDAGTAQARLAGLLLARLEQPLSPAVQEAFLAILIRLEWTQTLSANFLQNWILESGGGSKTSGRPKADPSGEVEGPGSTGLPRTLFDGQPGMLARGMPELSEAQRRNFPRILAIRSIGELGLGAEPWVSELRLLLRHPEEGVVQASLESLAMLTNREIPAGLVLREQAARVGRWLDEALQTAHGCLQGARGLELARSGVCSLDSWWLSGFREAGFPVSSLNLYAVPVLEKALYAPFPLSVNAHRLLMRLTGARLEHAPDSWEEVQIFWARWLKRNGAKVYPPVPKKVSKKVTKKGASKAEKKATVKPKKRRK